jgi:hypothetical protein
MGDIMNNIVTQAFSRLDSSKYGYTIVVIMIIAVVIFLFAKGFNKTCEGILFFANAMNIIEKNHERKVQFKRKEEERNRNASLNNNNQNNNQNNNNQNNNSNSNISN